MTRNFPLVYENTTKHVGEIRDIKEKLNTMGVSEFKKRTIITDMLVRFLSSPPPLVDVGETILEEFIYMENIDIHATSKPVFGTPCDIFDALLKSKSFNTCIDIIMGKTQYVLTETKIKALLNTGYYNIPRAKYGEIVQEIKISKWGCIENLHKIIPDDFPISAQLYLYNIRINGYIGDERYKNVIPTLRIMFTMLCCETRVGNTSKLRLLHTDIFRLIYKMLN